SGLLNTPARIQQEVNRLFESPRAKIAIRRFYSQWLRVDHIPTMMVSAAFANGLNPQQFKQEAQQEIIDFMDHLIWTQKGNYTTMLTSNLVFAKGPNLASIYGVNPSPQPQTISDPNRKGLLTRAGMLAMS